MSDNRLAIAHVIANGHSFAKHGDEFRDRSLGPILPDNLTGGGDVTRSEVANFIRMTLADPQAMTFTSPPNPPKYPESAQFIYSQNTNTLVVLDPRNTNDFGTVYRPDRGIEQFTQMARNSPGSPTIRHGTNAVNGALERFEQEIFNRPALRATLEARAQRLGTPVQEPSARTTPNATPNAGAAEAAEQATRAANAAAAAEEATRLANEILENTETLGFLADSEGRTMHFFSEEHNAIVSIDTEGNKTLRMGRDDIIDEFLELQQRAAGEFGQTVTEIVPGGLNGVDGYFQGLNSGRLARALEFFGDASRVLAKTASILGPVGMLAAGAATAAEVDGLYGQSDIARTLGVIPSDEALHQYYAILGVHATQATADPSIAGGEAITQGAFDLWCDTYDIPQEWRDRLEPESLIEMVFGDGEPSSDPNAAYNDPFFAVYDALPTEINADMPPEVQSLAELKALIMQGEAELQGNTDFTQRDSIIERLERAENMYTEHYDTMMEDGQIQVVQAYLEAHALPQNPDNAAPEEPPTRTAEHGLAPQATPTPM